MRVADWRIADWRIADWRSVVQWPALSWSWV
jgi:hypothetical protein